MVVNNTSDDQQGGALGCLIANTDGCGAEAQCPSRLPIDAPLLKVGRYPDCDVIIRNPCVSGRHCVISKRERPTLSPPAGACVPGGRTFDLVLADMSTNGCFLNGERIGKGHTALLEHGDRLELVVSAVAMHTKYNIAYVVQYPATVVSATNHGGAAAASQRPAETLPLHASQLDGADQINQGELEDDTTTSSSSKGGAPAPVAPAAAEVLLELDRSDPVKHRHIREAFDVDEEHPLGSGTFATVYRAVHRRTKTVVAVKQINKRRLMSEQGNGTAAAAAKLAKDAERQRREVEILLAVRHAHVVRCYGVYETDDFLWLVLSFAAGGELFQMLQTLRPAPEILVRRITAQLCVAVQYLHSVGVAHRDIKLENLLLLRPLGPPPDAATATPEDWASWSDSVHVQVSDFGLSRLLPSDSMLMTTMCGTPVYVAPEVTDVKLRVDGAKGYTASVDLFSIGVVAFALLTGRPPFPFQKDRDGKPVKNRVDYGAPLNWGRQPVSAQAKGIVSRLLALKPEARPSPGDCLQDPWLLPFFTPATAGDAHRVSGSEHSDRPPSAKRHRFEQR